MKKIVSSVLIAVFAISLVVFFNVFTIKAEAATEIEIYRATNTYDEDTIEKDKKVAGYERNQYIITYDMDNKKTDRLVAESPTVTVFTHGYNSSSKDWLNNAEYVDDEKYFVFQYNNASMVDKVINLYGVDNAILIIANMTDYKTVSLTRYVLSNSDGVIIKESETENYEIGAEAYGKHIVVVFNRKPGSGNDSNNNLYFQFNYMLSSILYDLKQLDPSHRIPKVNLIGHSRGGLTNMQYALDHPDIVANLISIGTPYEGSTSATLVQYDENFNGDGLTDIIDPDKYNDYQNRWNTGYNTLYKNINVLAVGAYSTLPFLSDMAHNDKSEVVFKEDWSVKLLDVIIKGVSLYKTAKYYIKFLGGLARGSVVNFFRQIFPKCPYISAEEILTNEIQKDSNDIVWFSDSLVPLQSQIGENYQGMKTWIKCFSMRNKNYNLDRIAQWMPPVVHNLEPWDEEIINRVVEELKPSVTDGTENFKYKENSDGTINISGLKAAADSNILDIPAAINGKTVRGISSGAFAGEPSVIGKLNASNANVASYAANSENYLANVTTINIPSTVTNISADAFSGMESLTTVNLGSNSQLNTIGENAFADCVNLKNINLPSGVTEIPYGAFENCKELESVTIPSGVTKIGAQAFCGAEKLSFTSLSASVTEIGELAFFGCKGSSSIALPSGVTTIGDGAFAGIENVTAFSVSSANANYTTENGVLYNKAKTELLQYPKAKTATTFTVNSDDEVVLSNVNTIKPYAFYGCENLTEVNINYVSKVETMAFANCSSLATIYALGVTNAELDAFSNTQWMENQLNNNNGKVVLGELLVLYAPENKTVMNLSEWDFGVAAIAENVFAFSDIETIYIPSGVSRWNEYAFANAQELKDVYVEKMNSSLLSSLRIKENVFGGNHADLTLHVTRSDNEAIVAMGQNALSDIPREVISTNVTCINNGVTTTRTLYYDEEYTLAGNGSVVWENEAGERYQNTGVWKSFETELTLNSLQVNNSWLTYNGGNKSPVALVEGDVVSLSYTESGVITVTVNGQVYTVDLKLPVGTKISKIESSDGQVVNLNNTVYTGQFTSFEIKTTEIEYTLTYTYEFFDSNGSPGDREDRVKFTASNYSSVVRGIFQKKHTKVMYNGNEYYVMGVYDSENYTNEITSFTPGTNRYIYWYLKCNRITYTVTLDYGNYTTYSNILYTSVSSSGSYSYKLPSCSRAGYTVTWVDEDSKTSYTPGTTVTLNGSRTLKLTFTCANHVLVKSSISDTQHEEKCNNCGYRKVSDHSIVVLGTTENLFTHNRLCNKHCGYQESEEHNWQPYNKMFKCTICNIRAATIPSIYDSLKFMIIDEQGNIKEISREEAMLIMKKYELEEEGDIAA